MWIACVTTKRVEIGVVCFSGEIEITVDASEDMPRFDIVWVFREGLFEEDYTMVGFMG